MKKRKMIITLICALAVVVVALFMVACNDKPEYSRKHKFESINANAVLHIERTRLNFAKDMSVDSTKVIEGCECMLIDPDSGEQLKITAADLKNGMVSYEKFDLTEVGRDKRIKLKFKQAENYIFYDVIDYKVNFYEDKSSTEPWRSARASAAIDMSTLGLSVWVDTATYNYATDETARDTNPDKAIRFNGWYDDDAAATGRYSVSAPSIGTERVLNLYADYLTDEQFEGLKLAYDGRGRLVFNGYDGDNDTVVVPEGVTYINMQEVFRDVSAQNPVGFKKLVIPSNAQIDAVTTAYNSFGLEAIEVDNGSPRYSSYNGALYSKDYKKLYFMPSSCTTTEFHEMLAEFDKYSCAHWQAGTLALPESVTLLNDYSFAYSALTSVAGLDRVSLGKGVFAGANVNSHEDGVALYTVLSQKNDPKPRYALSMILDKSITEYAVLDGTESIAGGAFNGCEDLTKIDLGKSLKSIGESAFSGCKSLEEIKFPSTLTTLGESVFYNCKALTKVEGLTDVTYEDGHESYEHTLPTRLFYGCESLTDITLPDELVTIAPYAFANCKSLTSIEIPSTVENIGTASFEASGLTSIEFPIGLEAFGKYAFRNCTSLVTTNLEECVNLRTLAGSCFYGTGMSAVTLPEQITNIPDHCFYNMPNLVSIDISGVVSLEDYAISQNAKLTTIVMGDGLKTIGTRALSSNKAITEITLPDSVQTIGGYAFAACTKLAKISIGGNVDTMGLYTLESDGVSFGDCGPVFYQCTVLKEIIVDENNEYFTSIDGVLYGKSVGGQEYDDKASVLYAVPCNYQNTTLTLPSTVKVILPYAVHYQRVMTNIELNDGLLNIGKGAFYNSTKLTSLTVPASVTNIGASILLSCTKVTDFVIAEGNTKYTSDGNLVYDGNNVAMYLGLVGDVVIRDGMTKINMGVFMNNAKITSVVIPDSVVTIDEKAFSGCSNLTSIEIGAGVQSIDPTAFASLSALEAITVSANNQYFKAVNNVLYSRDGKRVLLVAANNEMTGLDQLEDGVAEIGDYAFAYHATLASVVLPSTVRKIGAYAFYECRGVEYFYASEMLESIGERAFSFATSITPNDNKETRYCDALKRVVLYGNLEGISDNAFYGQYGIQYVYFKMTYAEAKKILSKSGKNYTYLTKGCQAADGSSNERYNNVVCCLYTATEPTIDYDGYTWFTFTEDGEPRPYNVERA